MTESYSNSRPISTRQQRLFQATLEQVENLGYRGNLLRRDYSFGDWFAPETPVRRAPAVAFGRTPVAYDSACLTVLLANGKSGKDLVVDYRAVGAPLAFEVSDDCVIQWKVGKDRESTAEGLRISLDALERVFKDKEATWQAQAVLRAKNVGVDLGPRQLDFIDLGLIPALESQIKGKLDRLLREVVHEATKMYETTRGQSPDVSSLFRLVFRTLAAKILHDRRVSGFKELPEPVNAKIALDKVAKYYNDAQPLPQNGPIQAFVAERLWNGADFQNLSVEVLAYIYENTLVDESVRRELGTHSTPHSIARYVLHRLPVEDIPVEERRVLEPFCGHAIFLVSALQRLRELLPGEMDDRERHRYFVEMLEGFEIDAFGLEVAKMCLMLADFPNHNGWRLENDDVFLSSKFASALQRARIVVCNPPFEDFDRSERAKYKKLRSVRKPAEILYRVLDQLTAGGMLGFVLPQSFLDGTGYRDIRKLLTDRYCDMELVSLPDRVFKHSDAETVLLIGKRSLSSAHGRSRVTLTEVKDRDREEFLNAFAFTRRDTAILTPERAAESLVVTALDEIWDRLVQTPKLGEVATIHRGVEWQPPFDAQKYLSPAPKPGFKQGAHSAAGHFHSFLTPPTEYLCIQPECRRGKAFDLPWDRSKVVMNAVRVSRGPWRVVAFPDEKGLVFSQSFTCLWPAEGWTVKSLSAVINGPVVNAFVATHELKKHVRKRILMRVPLPRLSSLDVESIDKLVDEFVNLLRERRTQPFPDLYTGTAREILLKIDAQVLRGYNLQPRLERQLLEFFRDNARPIPFSFEEYYPSSFSPHLPLWMYISRDLENCTARRLMRTVPKITDPELVAALEEGE